MSTLKDMCKRRCCVPSCKLRGLPSYTIPINMRVNYFDRVMAWLKAVDRLDLKYATRQQLQKLSLRVCRAHFKDDDFKVGTGRLKEDAVPTQFVPVDNTLVNISGIDAPVPKKAKCTLDLNLDNVNFADEDPTCNKLEINLSYEKVFGAKSYSDDHNELTTTTVTTETTHTTIADTSQSEQETTIDNVENFEYIEESAYNFDDNNTAPIIRRLYDFEILDCINQKIIDATFCRICLLKLPNSNKFDLFPNENHEQQEASELREKLLELFPNMNLELLENPAVCPICRQNIETSYDLKHKVEKSEKDLLNLLKPNKPKPKTSRDFLIKSKLDKLACQIESEVRVNRRIPKVSRQDSEFIKALQTNPNIMDPSHDAYFKVERRGQSTKLKKLIKKIYYKDEKPTTIINNDEIIVPMVEASSSSSSSNLSRINKTKKKNRTGLCEICGVIYKGDKHRYAHGAKVNKTYICHVCGVIKRNYSTFAFHQMLYHRKAKCAYCQAVLSNAKARTQHVRAVHPEHVVKHQCCECGKIYDTSSSLQLHMRTHNPDYDLQRFQCSKCTKVFRAKEHLKRHEQKHLNENNVFTCPYCKSRKMRSTESLQRHLKIFHHNDPVNQCVVCERSFWKFGTLKLHMQKCHGLTIENKKHLKVLDLGDTSVAILPDD